MTFGGWQPSLRYNDKEFNHLGLDNSPVPGLGIQATDELLPMGV